MQQMQQLKEIGFNQLNKSHQITFLLKIQGITLKVLVDLL